MMPNGSTVLISKNKIEEAKKIGDELDSLIETAEVLNDKFLMQSIKKSEEDIKKGKFTGIASKKELEEFFKRQLHWKRFFLTSSKNKKTKSETIPP